MQTGLIFNAFISSLVMLAAIFVGASLWTKRKEKNLAASFAALWLTFSFIWFFSTVRTTAAFFERPDLDEFFFKMAQAALFLHIIFLGNFIFLKVFNKKWISYLVILSLSVLGAVAVFFIFEKGVVFVARTYFSTKYSIHAEGSPSWLIFNIEYFAILPLYIFDVSRTVFNWLRRFKISEFYYFLASFSVLLYVAIGYFDEKGFIAGWPLMLFRLSYIVAMFFAYLSFHPLRESAPLPEASEMKSDENPSVLK